MVEIVMVVMVDGIHVMVVMIFGGCVLLISGNAAFPTSYTSSDTPTVSVVEDVAIAVEAMAVVATTSAGRAQQQVVGWLFGRIDEHMRSLEEAVAVAAVDDVTVDVVV